MINKSTKLWELIFGGVFFIFLGLLFISQNNGSGIIGFFAILLGGYCFYTAWKRFYRPKSGNDDEQTDLGEKQRKDGGND